MAKFTIVIAIIISALVSVYSEEALCPEVKLMENFKADQYVGKWYEIQRYPMLFEEGNKCIMHEYTLNDNGTLGIHNMAIIASIDEPIHMRALAVPNENPANFTVGFHNNANKKGKYWVLDTDYKTYSLVYACSHASDKLFRVEFAWILSRTPTLNTKVIGKLTKNLEAFGSNVNNFETTDQKDCDYTHYDSTEEDDVKEQTEPTEPSESSEPTEPSEPTE